MEKEFIVCVGGTYGAEDLYIVRAENYKEAKIKADLKYDKTIAFSGAYIYGQQPIIFDSEGISNLITTEW